MNFLQKISAFLARQTSLFIICISVVAFFYRPLFGWERGTVQTLTLGIIMLAMGMTLSSADFKILAKRPWDIFIGAVAQYTIMPFLAFGVTKLLHLDTGFAVGLILVGCCPGGVSSNIMSFLCKGDVAFSVGMTTASTLLAPIMTPMLVLFLAGKAINVDAVGMFQSILIVTILPVTIGFLANTFAGKTKTYQSLVKLMPGISVIGLACIVGGVISQNGEAFFKSGAWIFLAILLHNGGGYLLGYITGLMTGMNKAQKRTIAIEIGMQNAGLATNLSVQHFAGVPGAAVVSAVSCVWHSISGALIAGLFLKIDQYREGHRQ